MVAVVLGTALSAAAPARVDAAPTAEVGQRAINDMSRYCSTCWRNARLPVDAWSDCTQEVFSRLLERVPVNDWPRVLGDEGEERREFLRAIDTVKKRTQRARKYSSALDSVADRDDLTRRQLDEHRHQVSEVAAELLTERQQRILQMSFEGWSVHDIAAELNVSTERVSDEKYKAIRKLRSHLVEADRDDSAARLTA
jgi:RNA polymerase sigma factor (sigma-70 family)